MNRASGIKISQFVGEDAITEDGMLTYVQDGTNYKIPYSAFKSAIMTEAALTVYDSFGTAWEIPMVGE